MSQQDASKEWQEYGKTVFDSLKAVGFSFDALGEYSRQDRIFTLTLPRHQVEWLRSYADIFYVQPAQEYFINAPHLQDYFCNVAFRMKDPAVSFPFADQDAILPPKPQS